VPKVRRARLAIALLAAGVFSCSLDIGRPSNPIVEILSPRRSADIALGHQRELQHRAANGVGVVRVELEVDGQIVGAQNSPLPEGQLSLISILRWTPTIGTPVGHNPFRGPTVTVRRPPPRAPNEKGPFRGGWKGPFCRTAKPIPLALRISG
jgi:hypothetical protein